MARMGVMLSVNFNKEGDYSKRIKGVDSRKGKLPLIGVCVCVGGEGGGGEK